MSCAAVKLHAAPPPVKLAVMVPVPVADGPVKLLNEGVTLTVAEAGPVPSAFVAVTEQL